MIKIPNVVQEILYNDEIALEAFSSGLLNLSAYADKIKSRVEKLTFKEVKKNTIVAALSRLSKTKREIQQLKPEVKLTNLSVKSPLIALTYEKTVDIQRRVATLNPFLIAANDLFSITEGPSEITLLCSEKSVEFIKKHMDVDSKNETEELVAVSAQFKQDYSKTPNVLYALLSVLAAKRLNLIEVVSTNSEISFIVKKTDMEETVKILNTYC